MSTRRTRLPWSGSCRAKKLRVLMTATGLALSASATAQWSSQTMVDAKTLFAAVTAGDRAYFAGGMDLAKWDFARDIVDIYDAGLDIWSATKLSRPRFRLTAAATDEYVAFAGGGPDSFSVDGTIDLLNLSTGIWSTDKLPIPVQHPGGVGLGSRMMFAGGITGKPDWLKIVQIFHPASGLWTTATLKGPKRFLIETVEDGRRAFFIAGMAKNPGTDIVNIYDSWTNVWTWTHMPHLRGDPAAAIVDGRLYVAGGNVAPDIMDVYDIGMEEWSSIRLPSSRINCAVTGVGPYVLVAAGTDGANHLDSVDVYSTRTGRWRSYQLTVAALQREAVSIGDRIAMIAGGQLRGSVASTDAVDVLRVQPLGDAFCGPANPNSTGRPAKLTAFGTPVASEDLVTLTAYHVRPGMPGLLLASLTQDFLPFAGGSQGNLCLGGAIARFTGDAAFAEDNGTLSFDPVLTAVPLNPPQAVQAGETWNFQVWYRDLNPGPTSNFTDGLELAFQ